MARSSVLSLRDYVPSAIVLWACRSSTEISRNPYHSVSIACAIAINLYVDICSSHSHLSLYNLLFVSAAGLTKLLVTHRIAGEPPTKCVRKRTLAYIVRSAHITHARTRACIHTGVGPLARTGIGYPPLLDGDGRRRRRRHSD